MGVKNTLDLTRKAMQPTVQEVMGRFHPDQDVFRLDPLSHLDAGHVQVLDVETKRAVPFIPYNHEAELIDAWVGHPAPNGQIRCGFIDLDATSADPVAQVRLAFNGRAARFVRSVTAVGPPKLLRQTVDAIAEAPRPFLISVTLRQWAEKATPTFGDVSAFVRATPHLQCLEIDARQLFGDLAHPSLRRLRISGFDAIRTLTRGQLALPALVELDLALQCHLASAKTEPPDDLFDRLGMRQPNLTALDLSRNVPGFLDPHNLGGEADVFAMLAKIGCRDRLLSLTLPPVVGPESIGHLRAALGSMPALRDLAIVRTRASEHPLLSKNFERPGLALRLNT